MQQEIQISIKLNISADATLSKEDITASINELLYGSIPDATHTGDHSGSSRQMHVNNIEYSHIKEESEIYQTEITLSPEDKQIKKDVFKSLYLETFYLVVEEIENAHRAKNKFIQEQYTIGGMAQKWELAKKFTDEFEALHKGKNWDQADQDWIDSVWIFMGEKLKG